MKDSSGIGIGEKSLGFFAIGIGEKSLGSCTTTAGAQKRLYLSSSEMHSQNRRGFRTSPSSHSVRHWNGKISVQISKPEFSDLQQPCPAPHISFCCWLELLSPQIFGPSKQLTESSIESKSVCQGLLMAEAVDTRANISCFVCYCMFVLLELSKLCLYSPCDIMKISFLFCDSYLFLDFGLKLLNPDQFYS